MDNITVKIQRMSPLAKIPNYQHLGDSGADICSIINYSLKPFEKKAISTGLKVEVPKGYEMQVRSRSGLALNEGIFVLNSPGTIDSGFRGEIQIILMNISDKNFEITIGQRIAQIVLSPVYFARFEECNHLEKSSRGTQGFGSTGYK